MGCWHADSDINDGRVRELASEREELEFRERPQDIKVRHGTWGSNI